MAPRAWKSAKALFDGREVIELQSSPAFEEDRRRNLLGKVADPLLLGRRERLGKGGIECRRPPVGEGRRDKGDEYLGLLLRYRVRSDKAVL